jgi:hypothetical protein
MERRSLIVAFSMIWKNCLTNAGCRSILYWSSDGVCGDSSKSKNVYYLD